MKGWHRHSHEHALAARGISTKQRIRAEGWVDDLVAFPGFVDVDYENPKQLFMLFWASSLKNDFSGFDWDRAFRVARGRVENQLRQHGLLGAGEYQRWLEEVYPWPMAVDDFYASSGFLDGWKRDDIKEKVGNLLKESDKFKEFVRLYAEESVGQMDGEELELEANAHGVDLGLSDEDKRNALEDIIRSNALEDEDVLEWHYTNLVGDNETPLPEWVAMMLVKEQSDDWRQRLLVDEPEGLLFDGDSAYVELMGIHEGLKSPPGDLQGRIVLFDRVVHAQHLGGSLWDEVEDLDRLRSRVDVASRKRVRA